MRASVIELRAGGRTLAASAQKVRRGTLSTIRFQGGETWPLPGRRKLAEDAAHPRLAAISYQFKPFE